MKKAFLILFCFFYLLSSAGVAFNLHYCGGKLKSISLRHSDEVNCCGKKMKNKKCCKERSFVYKVKGDQDPGGKYFSFKSSTDFSILYVHSTISSLQKTGSDPFFLPDHHAPPEFDQGSTYLVNGVFRI